MTHLHPRSFQCTKIALSLAVLLNLAVWYYARPIKAEWINVPPVPSTFSAAAGALGDKQLAYRTQAIFLQNLGSNGGRVTPIKNYNFERLAQWFFLGHALDPRADALPFLAAFYYGGSQDPTKIRPVLEYLKIAGNSAEGDKWRWLAHGAYLARFKLKDPDLALEMAQILSAIPNPDMPVWARQMPANILNDQGEKEASLQLMLGLLKTGSETLHPNEVNAMIDYICERILNENEAMQFDLCNNIQ